MVLKHVRLRCSFANQDTGEPNGSTLQSCDQWWAGGGNLNMLASCDYYAHVLQVGFAESNLCSV